MRRAGVGVVHEAKGRKAERCSARWGCFGTPLAHPAVRNEPRTVCSAGGESCVSSEEGSAGTPGSLWSRAEAAAAAPRRQNGRYRSCCDREPWGHASVTPQNCWQLSLGPGCCVPDQPPADAALA